MLKRLTDTEIAVRIVPHSLRWPKPSTGDAWRQLHECVQSLRGLIRSIDNKCEEVGRKTDLRPDAITQHCADIGSQALVELANFRPFEVAQKAAAKEIDILENRCETLKPPELQTKQKLIKALDQLRAGIPATERLVLELCKMREGFGKFGQDVSTSVGLRRFW